MNALSRQIYSLNWLPQRLGVSVRALASLLYFSPRYMFTALGLSILFYEVVFWFLNVGLAHYLLSSSYLSGVDKIEILIGSYAGVFSAPFSKLSITLFLVSLFQGVSVAGLMYILRRRKQSTTVYRELGGTGIAGILSLLGLGCAACGTSLIMPIVSLFFASTSLTLIDTIGFYSMIVALLVSIFSAYVIGLKVAVLQ